MGRSSRRPGLNNKVLQDQNMLHPLDQCMRRRRDQCTPHRLDQCKARHLDRYNKARQVLNTLAVAVHAPQVVLRVGIALIGSLAIPPDYFGVVLLPALAE